MPSTCGTFTSAVGKLRLYEMLIHLLEFYSSLWPVLACTKRYFQLQLVRWQPPLARYTFTKVLLFIMACIGWYLKIPSTSTGMFTAVIGKLRRCNMLIHLLQFYSSLYPVLTHTKRYLHLQLVCLQPKLASLHFVTCLYTY
jgi:hypothetical protein